MNDQPTGKLVFDAIRKRAMEDNEKQRKARRERKIARKEVETVEVDMQLMSEGGNAGGGSNQEVVRATKAATR